MNRITCLTLGALLAGASAAWPQCPNGTPPPCPETVRPARRDPPLDNHTWLVLPFNNLAHDAALDGVRDASVTLMYLEMSKWNDIRVIDDSRVSDLMQSLPNGSQIGQEAAFALARHVGAGRVVIGNVLKEGGRTALMTGVFDVRSGQRLRSPRLWTTGTDSLSQAFGALAEQVLALPRPAGSGSAPGATSSIQALRAYAAGIAALRRWRTDSAATLLRTALDYDSTFAMAHLYLGIALDVDAPAQAAREYAAAQRLGGSLPPRNRLLVRALSSTTSDEERCQLAADMLRSDSSEAYGWWALGRCLYHTPAPVAIGSDGPRYVGFSRSAAIRAYERALALDTSNVLLFGWLANALQVLNGGGCDIAQAPCPGSHFYWSHAQLNDDSIVDLPVPWAVNPYTSPRLSAAAANARAILYRQLRDLAQRWTAMNPAQWYGHWVSALALRHLGDYAGAERELAASTEAASVSGSRRLYYRDRIYVALSLEHPAQAAALLDSMWRDPTAIQQPQLATTFGRFSHDLSGFDSTSSLASLRARFVTLYAGIRLPGIDSIATEYADRLAAGAPPAIAELTRQAVSRQAALLGFRARGSAPVADTASIYPLARSEAFLSLGDTTRARQALASFDDLVRSFGDDVGYAELLFGAEQHLALGDSAAAYANMTILVQRWPHFCSDDQLMPASYPFTNSAERLGGRAWLLYADLAAARGDRAQARRGYRMVVGLWDKGEGPVQPLVARARAALVQLGS